MEIRGKLVIIVIFGTAVAAAVFAWTFQYLRGRRVLELWGPETARLIRVEADHVELLALESEATGGAEQHVLEIDQVRYHVARRTDISRASGLIHARQALIEDASFAWEQPRGDCAPQWQFAILFRQDERQATVLIDTNCRRARRLETGDEASIKPIFDGLMKFIDEKLAPQEESHPPGS